MMWKQLSDEFATAAAKASKNLVQVGGPGIAGRTALVWAEGVAVTLARQAADGEAVPVVLAGGTQATATVHAYDSRTGLAVLKVPGLGAPDWKHGGLPKLGNLVMTTAFASPQGAEARLDLVRFVGGENLWGRGVKLTHLIQTDGSPFPGFTGAAVIDSDGALIGFVAENGSGNGAFVVPVADLARLVEPLVRDGSPKRAWLGVSTRPGGGQGLVLVGVDAGSPSDTAGWKVGDLLVSLAGEALREPSDLVRALASLKPGVEVAARILRDGEVHDKPVVPGGR